MCGIIGYIGKDLTVKSVDLGIEALKRLNTGVTILPVLLSGMNRKGK